MTLPDPDVFANVITRGSAAVLALDSLIASGTVIALVAMFFWRKLRGIEQEKEALKRSAERFVPKYERAGWQR